MLLCACGTGAARAPVPHTAGSEDPYVSEPFTRQQELVERGAHLFVGDGCSSCHAIGGAPGIGPGFGDFAGHRVTLAGGRHVLVDEAFLRRALRDPRATAVAGYPPAPMLAAVQRLQLQRRPADVAALAAFIEQIGPEP